jgi:multiple sugar transport system permease protein
MGSLVFYMLPPITLVGPWYVMFRSIGWDNTYIALVLAHVTLNLPIGVAVMSVFVRDIPLELEQAARLDGCTTPQMLWRIVVPLVRPGLAATAILVFVFSWNEFPVALTLSGSRTATVPVAIAKFAQEYEIKNGVMAAGVVLSVIPAVLLLLFAHRHIVKGLTAGIGK